MKLVEKDIKAKKASDKVEKKNSLSTSGVQDDDQHILDPPTSALEKSKKVAKVRYTSQMSPPNTIVSKQHNQEAINATSNMTTRIHHFKTFIIKLMAVNILDNTTLALQLQEFLEKCADAGNIELVD
ncbi:protein FAR1-RELATED SEQUENCE 5-like [Pyrus ussuriensis x Pyrus communis]|uniref:Protein FAR1-RELATED SEQUENCE 5-like n=1 Tax=Pyrus ussuriensis x Pyrus communis TaxID=2448454 RepID=A0A5N5FUI1_9ROSA|nr:protein FAR1-RELATED SEQUENCE 5-like [Pyrus ussuriensis x Pyrus communis]